MEAMGSFSGMQNRLAPSVGKGLQGHFGIRARKVPKHHRRTVARGWLPERYVDWSKNSCQPQITGMSPERTDLAEVCLPLSHTRSPAAKAAIFTGCYAAIAGCLLTLAPALTFGGWGGVSPVRGHCLLVGPAHHSAEGTEGLVAQRADCTRAGGSPVLEW